MPVHHEKTERKTTEATTSKNRTKQRELSVERRPIISQDKPNVSKSKTVRPKPTSTTTTTTKIKLEAKEASNKSSLRVSNQKHQGQKQPSKLSKSDYLNEEKKVVKSGTKTHDRSKTRTLSPSQVKILTVKKDEPKIQQNETDYEDDFEDYESDFEEDDDEDEDENEEEKVMEENIRKRILVSSAEEKERKLDSGSYHISAPLKKEMEEIKIAMQNENRLQRKQSVVEDADEGYLEETITKSNFLDFSGAGKRNTQQMNQSKAMKRGEELLKMITLDMITYILLEIPAVPYDVFMTSFGKTNTTQIHVQTNEDDCEEETQTDFIETVEKWTQMPVTFTPIIKDDGSRLYNPSNEERLGVGGQKIQPPEPIKIQNYGKKLTNAAQKILIWLETQTNHYTTKNANKSELSCCDGMTILKNDINKTEQSVTTITITNNSHLILTVEINKIKESKIKIWSILTPSFVIKILMCRQELTSICFGPGRGDLIFAAAKDGSINLWDLRESNQHNLSELGQSPTYSTSQVLKQNGHLCPVASLIVLTKQDDYDDFRPIQICSLDLNGTVIIWSVVQQISTHTLEPNSDLGLAPWGRVRLVKSSTFTAQSRDEFSNFTVMASRGQSGNELLIGISNGQVLHILSDGTQLKPKYYEAIKNSRPCAITAISTFSPDDRFFLVGCNDGTIRLHSVNQEKPLINLHWNLMDSSQNSSIKSLHWFPTRPCMFFAIDSASRIHVWNLSVSDIYPQLTIPGSTQNPVISAATLKPKTITQTGSIVLSRLNGSIEIHTIKSENDKIKAINEWKKESKMFQKYVKIL